MIVAQSFEVFAPSFFALSIVFGAALGGCSHSPRTTGDGPGNDVGPHNIPQVVTQSNEAWRMKQLPSIMHEIEQRSKLDNGGNCQPITSDEAVEVVQENLINKIGNSRVLDCSASSSSIGYNVQVTYSSGRESEIYVISKTGNVLHILSHNDCDDGTLTLGINEQ